MVIGILIALQINNKNEERIQAQELNGLMKSISRAIQSDIKNLQLIRVSRENIGNHSDSIFNSYIEKKITNLTFDDYAYLANTFNDLTTTVYYQPNTSSFDGLKNSIYLSKLQGTDIELLLHTYYASAERIQKQEEDYNQQLKDDYQNWSNEFRNNGSDLFKEPWNFKETKEKLNQFLKVLFAENTKSLFAKGFEEENMTNLYDLQITLGEKYIEMINSQRMNFDEQTKIDFSNISYSYEEVDVLYLLYKGKVPPNFGFIYAQSSNEYYDGIHFEDGYAVLTYPENTFLWGSPYFTIEALNGRMNEMDFSKYKNVILEMKGKNGGEQIALAMKDKYDLPDGTEARVDITLTKTWETYEVPTVQFKTADMQIIETPLGFVFLGNEGRTIHVKSIQFIE